MDAGTAVGAPAAGMAVLDGHAQRIRGHPARVGGCEAPQAVLPCVVPRARDAHGQAEGGDRPACGQPGDDGEGVAQDRDLAQEAVVVRPRADQLGLHGLGEGSLAQLAPVVAGLGNPVAQAVNADAKVPGNMGHGNVAGPCQQDRLVAELRGLRCDVRPDDRHGQIDGAGISGSWQVAGSHSTPRCGCRNGNNASTGHGVSLPGQCGRCSGDCPLFGCTSTCETPVRTDKPGFTTHTLVAGAEWTRPGNAGALASTSYRRLRWHQAVLTNRRCAFRTTGTVVHTHLKCLGKANAPGVCNRIFLVRSNSESGRGGHPGPQSP